MEENKEKMQKMLKEINNLRERIKNKSSENEDLRSQLESQEIEMGTHQQLQQQKKEEEQKV